MFHATSRLFLLVVTLFLTGLASGCTQVRSIPLTTTPEGWEQHQVVSLSLALPKTYTALNNSDDIDAWITSIEEQGAAYRELAQTIANNRQNLLFWAYDSDWKGEGCPPLVQVTRIETNGGGATMSDAAYNSITTQLKTSGEAIHVQITAQERVRWGEILIAHYVTEGQGACRKADIYVIPQGQYFYSIAYSAETSEYEQLTSMFEQSVGTFSTIYGEKE